MTTKSYRPIPKQLGLFDRDDYTGNECELCHLAERKFSPLIVFHLDRDCSNVNETNLARVCPSCYRHLDLALPEGIAKARTQFAFLINRGLYPDHKTDERPGQTKVYA